MNPALLLLGLGVPLALAFSGREAKAKSKPGPAKTPPREVPAELNARIARAFNAQNVPALRALGVELRRLGFDRSAGVVELKAQELELRNQRAPTTPGGLPDPLQAAFEAARGSGSVPQLISTAKKLDAAGFSAAAETLRQVARQVSESQRGRGGAPSPSEAAPLPFQPGGPGRLPQPETAPPFAERSPGQPQPQPQPQPRRQPQPGPPPFGTQPPPGGLPAALQSQFEQALRSTNVQALTSVAFVLESAGFPEQAAALRQRAKVLAPSKPSPPAAKLPGAGLDANMPAALSEQVARQLSLQGNPEILERLAVELKRQGFPNSANALRAKAALVRASIDAGDTLGKVDRILKGEPVDTKRPGPGEPTFTTQPVPARPPPPAVSRPPVFRPPVSAPQPAPQPILPPVDAALIQQSLKLATHLHSTRKFKEDRKLVRAWQLAVELKPDGFYGADSTLKLAELVDNPPPVYYWPKKNSKQKKQEFAIAMNELAKRTDSPAKAGNLRRVAAQALEGT